MTVYLITLERISTGQRTPRHRRFQDANPSVVQTINPLTIQ